MRSLLRLFLLPLAVLLTGWSVPPPLSAGAPPTFPAPLIDCNENGIEDAVDIAFGTSSDADQDGVPDECQQGRPEGHQNP